ncbi:MAG: transcriptional regulator [Desulfobacteraceae bacterium]|nr:MAG: transcriptional regulator [Desulfobacteraceae bacterium]
MADQENNSNHESLGQPTGTVRQRITQLLEQEELTARDISQRLGIREKEVYDHLIHISRTMIARGKKLRVPPFACLSCGYVFKERDRFTRPGRCPRCRGTRIQMPVYRLS